MQAGCVFIDKDNKITRVSPTKTLAPLPHRGTQNPNHQQAILKLSTLNEKVHRYRILTLTCKGSYFRKTV